MQDEWPIFKDSQWKLLWNYQAPYLNRSIGYLMLKLELASVVAEKVNNICLYCATDVDFCAQLKEDDSRRNIQLPDPFHDESPIHLSKQSSYHYNFSKQFDFYCWNNLVTVSVTVRLVMLKCTLDIINEVKVPPLALGNELGGLLAFETGEKKNKFTDVTFNIITNESMLPSTFFAHKAVLAARSPVFAKMFEHDLQESATNSVMLSDVSIQKSSRSY